MGLQSKITESKRSLGQNFFINKNLAKQISKIVLKENPDVVVEIGPGKGSFTEFLSKHTCKLFLIEKDDVLSKELLKEYPTAKVKNTDFLEWDEVELERYEDKKIIFFGSLPYNVSKKIIKKIIKSKYFNNNCYFIIQKEVGQKYIEKEPNNNFLSVSTRLYADVSKLFNISPESFNPKPKVTSSFMKFSPKQICHISDKQAFETFLKACFKQPRKTLRNNLKNLSPLEDEKSIELLSKRPQHLSLKEFLFLFSNIK